MNCADCELLICDYADGTLSAAQRAAVESHLAQCPLCAELARDSAAALSFIERVEAVEPPPELITRILFEAPWNKGKVKQTAWRKWLAGALSPVLQPRFAMSMALTILSLSMLFRYIAPAPASPAKIWANVEDQAYRAWTRTVKFYDNLKFVYQIQGTLRRWQQQQEDNTPPAAGQEKSGAAADDRKLPVTSPPGNSGGAASSKATGGNR
jgi:hypothetical protein